MVNGWSGKKESIGETGEIWWKDKEEVLVNDGNINDRNIWKYENNYCA